MTEPSAKETLTHLFKNVLEINSDDIKMVGKAGFKKYKRASYNTLTTHRDKDEIITSLW